MMVATDKAQEWTVGTTVSSGDKFPAIMCDGKVIWFTCLSSDKNELRQLCAAHNSAITAAIATALAKVKQ